MIKISDTITREINDRLASSEQVAIVSHINPDGDSIGSILGLYWYVIGKGIAAKMMVPNEIPFFLHWMPGCSEILVGENEPDTATEYLAGADLIFCLDFNEQNRMDGLLEGFEKSNAFKILIDHHPYPEDFADITISSPQHGSAAEMVYDFIKLADPDNKIDKKVAECLFTGIMTDTGCFTFSSSDPATYLAIADLLKAGIDKDRIYNLVYENYSDSRMKLMGYSIDKKMSVVPGFNTAYIALTREELEKYNHVIGDTEGFVNLPFSIKGIKVTALFIEKEDLVKISFRSRGEFAINQFAEKYFNGGGHKNAAGGESNLSLDETIRKFVDLIRNHKKELS